MNLLMIALLFFFSCCRASESGQLSTGIAQNIDIPELILSKNDLVVTSVGSCAQFRPRIPYNGPLSPDREAEPDLPIQHDLR